MQWNENDLRGKVKAVVTYLGTDSEPVKHIELFDENSYEPNAYSTYQHYMRYMMCVLQ